MYHEESVRLSQRVSVYSCFKRNEAWKKNNDDEEKDVCNNS